MKTFTTELNYDSLQSIGLRDHANTANRALKLGDYENALFLSTHPLSDLEVDNPPVDYQFSQTRLNLIEHTAKLRLATATSGEDLTQLDAINNGFVKVLTHTEDLLGLDTDEPVDELNDFVITKSTPRQHYDIEQIASVHARALSGLARVACAVEVIQFFDDNNEPIAPLDISMITEDQKYFGRDYAHGFGLLANDWDLVRGNAGVAIRAEALKGGLISSAHALVWIKRYQEAAKRLSAQGQNSMHLDLRTLTQRGAVASIRQNP